MAALSKVVRVVRFSEQVPYEQAFAWQSALRDLRVQGRLPDTLLCMQHEPVYSIGKRGSAADFKVAPEDVAALGASIHRSDRGGEVTFHGPGQWVCYPVYGLRELELGARAFVKRLEGCVIATVGAWGLQAAGDPGSSAGVWVGERKVGAVGIRISRGVSTHGVALNVNTDLSWFDSIVPCGQREKRVTSLEQLLGEAVPMAVVREQLIRQLTSQFGHSRVSALEPEALLAELRRQDVREAGGAVT